MRRLYVLITLTLISSLPIFAGGKVETIVPKSPESWNESFDINGKKGKHNVLITATDIAGNEYLHGPFNLFVDPKSDLPLCAISNPHEGSIVKGNMNIVGTAVDDDGVAYVEFMLDGSDAVRAQGKEFWSFFLNTQTLSEGVHTIEAYAVDINGVKGPSTVTNFHLNRKKPVTVLEDRDSMNYASGKVKFRGQIEDGNGIERLLYSSDNGERFDDVKISVNKKLNTARFELTLDTTKLEDGPRVLWFKAIDKKGAEGIYTYLLYVDNTVPDITVLYPDSETAVGGAFSLAGRVYDTVGIKQLSYKYGKLSGDFELTPGDPYFVQEFDLTAEKGNKVTIEVTATDLAGNVRTVKRDVKIDRELDLPQVTISSPQPLEQFDGAVFLSGVVFDKYGAGEIRYSLDKQAEITVPCEPSGFATILEGVSGGAHTLKVTPVNVRGVVGKSVTVNFQVSGAAPSICFSNEKTVLSVANTTNGSAEILVRADAGLKNLFYDIDSTGPLEVKVKNGETNTIIKIPYKKDAPPQLKRIAVTATDIHDRMITQQLVLSISDINAVGAETTVDWALNDVNAQNRVLITDEYPLSAVYTSSEGGVAASVVVEPAGAFEATLDGALIQVKPLKDGNADLQIRVTDSLGVTTSSKTIAVFADLSAPKIRLNDGNTSMTGFVKNSLVLQGSAQDGAGIKSLAYTVDGAQYTALATDFNQNINLASLADGAFVLKIIAEDNAGRKTTAYRSYYKNSAGPEVTMILPATDDVVNGTVTAAFVSESLFPLSKAEYKAKPSDEKWTEMPISTMPHTLIGSAQKPISKDMIFRFTDITGVERIYQSYGFSIDAESDKPVVEIHLPQENEVITENFTLSGIVYDDDGVKNLYYSIDGQPYKAVETSSSNYSVDMPLSLFNDNEHTISLYAEDIYGVVSAPVERKIRVSLENPQATIHSPTTDITVNGIIALKGTASDKNGIGKVEISVDNGSTYNLAEGAENWSYTLNTSVLNDGPHVVFVKATDNYNCSALYSYIINTDNTAPVMKFTYPLSDASFESDLFISGHAFDNVLLESVTASIRPLSDGAGNTAAFQNMPLTAGAALISKTLDVRSLPEGFYNLELLARDKGQNITRVSRNFRIKRSKDANRIDLMYPLNGEYLCGEFNVYGRIFSEKPVESASLYVDGKFIETVNVSTTNFVSYRLHSELIGEGNHKISIRATFAGNKAVESDIHEIEYNPAGPWVAVDNFAMGDFAVDRPWLKGSAGYMISETERDALKSKQTSNEEKRQIKLKKVKKIEVSFDNGKTYTKTKGKPTQWKFRLQTQDLAEGSHFLLVKATMENNEVAVSRTIVNIDKTLPSVTLITPGEGGRYNQAMDFQGIVSDDVELQDVTLQLRKGDKSAYGVPVFVQGLHFEAGFWGASLWNIGLGLSFFDNKVKVQFHYGQFTQKQYSAITKTNDRMRYGGNIFAFKLLASVLDLPVGRYAGPDWDWLHFTAALGANFSIFTQTQSGKPQLLSAVVMQLGLPRVELPKKKVKYFRSYGFFVEGSLWFIPTDVDSKTKGKDVIQSIVPHLSCGFRIDVF